MKEKIEDAFLEWQLGLKEEAQESVAFDHYDRPLKMVFVRRTEDFDLEHLSEFKNSLTELDSRLLVGTIRRKNL